MRCKWRWLVITVVAVGLCPPADAARADDPRPPSDTPFDGSVEPEQRMSRRAQRRASRRRVTAAAPPSPIDVTTTLASPFESMSAGSREPFIVHRDQPYSDASRQPQQFDIYLPKGCGGSLPLVIWIHGDTWHSGSKTDCPITWLVEAGYAVASIDYRSCDAAPFPAPLDDCRAAIAALDRDAETWGIDRDRICVAGRAAGGHLAALAGLWDRAVEGRSLPHIAAICAIDAPAHLTTLGPEHDRATSPASRLVGGPLPEFREAAQQASPIVHVSSDDPPVLLVHARGHAAVPFEQSQKFAAVLRAAGVKSTFLPVDGTAGTTRLDRDSPAGIALVEFLDATLGPGTQPTP